METLMNQQKEQKDPKNEFVPLNNGTKGTGFSDRLKKVIGDRSGRAFAKEVGISYSTLHNYLTDVSSPTLDNLIALANSSGVSLQWLATGESQAHIQPNDIVTRAFERLEREHPELDGISIVNSFRSINVSAGFGSFNEGITKPDGQEPYSNELLQRLGVQAEYCGVFWAGGRSMHPTIADGDQMLVSFKHKEVKGNNIYLVQNGDSVWVKRVKVLWYGVELISDNKEEYEPIRITTDEAQNLQIIGQVVHTGHSLV